MKSNLRNPLESCLLCLLLLFAACRGAPVKRESSTSWQECKKTSEEILQELWQLNVHPTVVDTTVPFPELIECRDGCDPDSLAKNSTHCLKKIRQGLYHYHALLVRFTNAELTAKLQLHLKTSLQLLSRDGGDIESISLTNSMVEWATKSMRDFILWRLQSFATLVTRVVSHCAALNENA